ncbi:hypothetical protein SO802_015949 [Lithocarpus litseifolius]|uniref:Uncharacterized protein n=1 Tax=Lithocarpus litseifolius TaxID=425828 RepID=A0AAW2CXJ1_9ROSI
MLARLLLLSAGAGSRRSVLAATASLRASTSSVTASGSTYSLAGAGGWRSAQRVVRLQNSSMKEIYQLMKKLAGFSLIMYLKNG